MASMRVALKQSLMTPLATTKKEEKQTKEKPMVKREFDPTQEKNKNGTPRSSTSKRRRRTSRSGAMKEPPPEEPFYGSLRRMKRKTRGGNIRVVIVGGGVAGLSAARILKRKGIEEAKLPLDVVILEARNRFGGRILTKTFDDGTRVDLGASFVHGCNPTNPIYAIAKEKKILVHTARGGYSEGWFAGPWYDTDASIVSLQKYKELERIHQSIREELRRQVEEWNSISEKFGSPSSEARDESLESAFERVLSNRKSQVDPIMRRLLDSKNVLMWGYTASLANVSLRVAFSHDDDDSVTSSASRRAHARECEHVKLFASETDDVDFSPSSLPCWLNEESRNESAESRWFCLHCRKCFSAHVIDKGSSRLSPRRPLHNAQFMCHMRKESHPLMVSMQHLSCWCGACGRFLDMNESDVLRRAIEKLHLAKFGCALRERDGSEDAPKSHPEDSQDFLTSASAMEEKMTETRDPVDETGRKKKQIGSAQKNARQTVGSTSLRLALKRSLLETHRQEPTIASPPRKKKKTKPAWRKRAIEESWIQCSRPKCGKWRKCDPTKERPRIDGKWYCEMNTWDLGRASCDCPEENSGGRDGLDWHDGLVVDGYSFLVKWLMEECEIGEVDQDTSFETSSHVISATSNTIVREILHRRNGQNKSDSDDDEAPCLVKTVDGREFEADYVIVALPLAILQQKKGVAGVTFDPPLSDEKQSAIRKMGMGSENKVILRWHPKNRFWPADEPFIQILDSRMRVVNLDYYGSKGTLVIHLNPPFSRGFDGLDDDGVVAEVLRVLSSAFGKKELPRPIEHHVTRWDADPYSGGSYSYLGVGSSTKDIGHLAAPEGNLLFAGEACSVEGHQCVHGAYLTGQAAGFGVLEATSGLRRVCGQK